MGCNQSTEGGGGFHDFRYDPEVGLEFKDYDGNTHVVAVDITPEAAAFAARLREEVAPSAVDQGLRLPWERTGSATRARGDRNAVARCARAAPLPNGTFIAARDGRVAAVEAMLECGVCVVCARQN